MKPPTSVTFRVKPDISDNGLAAISFWGLRGAIGELRRIPDKLYEVTWTVSKGSGTLLLTDDRSMGDATLCIFPKNWRNVRLRRTVRVL